MLADSVVVAKGMRLEKELVEALRDEVAEVYTAGDCVAPRKALNAIDEGFRVGVKI